MHSHFRNTQMWAMLRVWVLGVHAGSLYVLQRILICSKHLKCLRNRFNSPKVLHYDFFGLLIQGTQ